MDRALRETLIADYATRRPGHGFGVESRAVHAVHRRNPLCGDEVELQFAVSEVGSPSVVGLRWEGRGCVVSQASAAMLVARVDGMALADIWRLSGEVHSLIMGSSTPAPGVDVDFAEDVAALAGIGRLSLRARCASLAWDALDAALSDPRELGGPGGPDRGPR